MRLAIYSPDGDKRWNIVTPDSKIKVYLEEKILRRCVAADDEDGVVWVVKADESGAVVVDHEKGEVVLERLTGKVQIRLARC